MTSNAFSRLVRQPAAPAASAQQASAETAAPAAKPVESAVVEPAAQPAAAAEPRLVEVAIVIGHRQPQAAGIFTGVMGTVAPKGQPEEQDQFKIDPQYRELSYLFTLGAGAGGVDEQTQFVKLHVDERDVDVLRANLIRGSSAKWDALYDMVGQSMGGNDMVGRMLQAEKANVRGAVDRFLITQGLQSYDVPVAYQVEVPQPDGDIVPEQRANEDALIRSGFPRLDTLRIDPLAEIGPTPVEDPATDALPADLKEHTGSFEISVSSAARILARDPDQALRVMANVLDLREHNMTIPQNVLTYGPASVQNVVMRPRVEVEDFGDSGYGDDYRQRG